MKKKKLIETKWKLDPRCVLPRSEKGNFDDRVVGDPCIVWDGDIDTWRMFYFAMSEDTSSVTGMAVSKSAEEIAAGDWTKTGLVEFTNPEDLFTPNGWHKWWVAMDARVPNKAAKIDGKYFSFFSSTYPDKRIQALWSEKLGGPWTVIKKPIIAPRSGDAPDSLHCDTPTAYWLEDENEMLIFYMAYPKAEQKPVPFSPFGSCVIPARWKLFEEQARVGQPILQPEENKWISGWLGGFQLMYDEGWYALINASPTPPLDKSDREPAPSLGGFAVCVGDKPDTDWTIDTDNSPIKHPDELESAELAAGIAVNFWRHHLLITPGGQKRIYTNSGSIGYEQMYSYVEARE